MKRLLICIVLCVLLLPARALAIEGCVVVIPLPETDTADVLRAAWGKNYENAPDVGGIYWDNDTQRFWVLLVDGGTEARRQEIIELVGNADWVGFKSCKYSYNQLKAVQDEIDEERKSRNGVVGLGIARDYVLVNILKEEMETVGRQYKDRYGDMVRIVEGGIPKTDAKGNAINIPKTGGAPGTPWLLALALCGLCLGLRKLAESR